MLIVLVRHAYLSTVTLGHLYVGPLTLATLEEPWLLDPDGPGGQGRTATLRESCVPDGTYNLLPHSGPRVKDVWALSNPALGVWPDSVPQDLTYGRASILIHSGNTTADIEGCILVGRRHGHFNGTDAVLESRSALDALRAALGVGSHHQLQIRPTAGTSEISHA